MDAADLGKKVLLIDRFDGGGSTRRSGGIYYAGGGTRAQREAGVEDSVENMFAYIKQENGGCVDDKTLFRFCKESPETFQWLEERVKVGFKSTAKDENLNKTVYYPKKTSYPPSYATLYQSGNEAAHPFTEKATPAARGNRPFGEYLTGNILFAALERAVETHPNITVKLHARAKRLIMKHEGECEGLVVEAILDARAKGMHVMLHEIGSGAPFFDQTRQIDQTCRLREEELFRSFGREFAVKSRRGVIVCTGGFFYNADMVKRFAPKYAGYTPLGNMGDDGSGIELCFRDAKAKLGQMDRCSAWKFTNPPFSFLRGVLINSNGERVGNEDTYGATFADFLVQKHGGKGWLVIDQEMWDEANEDCMNPESGLQEDQRMQGLANLHRNFKKGETLQELADVIKAKDLVATMNEYNENVNTHGKDLKFHKLNKYLKPVDKAPFYAINLNMVGNKYWPTPSMSLGGVVVEGESGLVISSVSGKPIKKLYAAGKCAVGIASNYYVSGLSLGDAVFTGRRAGRHVGNGFVG